MRVVTSIHRREDDGRPLCRGLVGPPYKNAVPSASDFGKMYNYRLFVTPGGRYRTERIAAVLPLTSPHGHLQRIVRLLTAANVLRVDGPWKVIDH